MSLVEFLKLSCLILKLLFSLGKQFISWISWRFRKQLPALLLIIGILIFNSLNLYLIEKRSQPTEILANVPLDYQLSSKTSSLSEVQTEALLENYQLLLSLGIKSRDLFLNLGQIEKALGNTEQAQTYFTAALQIDSDI
jgi:tetratricopeptide (TPR) repeat protein